MADQLAGTIELRKMQQTKLIVPLAPPVIL